MHLSSPAVRKGTLIVTLSALAIMAAPLVMNPAYEQLQPRTGAMTVVLVEVLYALFIDFPLATLYVALRTRWVGPPRNAARSALAFVATFFAMIFTCIGLAPLSPVLSYWALADTFPDAVDAARHALGDGTMALLLIQFVVFDCLLCATGGIVGATLASSRHTRPRLRVGTGLSGGHERAASPTTGGR
jgi:hypothetical protein